MCSKVCPTCKQDLPIESFEFKDKEKTRRSSWCRKCTAEYKRKHYLERREKYVSASVIRNNQRRAELRKIVFGYLADHNCVDCGEADPIVLDFDHLDPDTKVESISRLITNFAKPDVLRAEMEKCEVRCANCHRRRHAKQSSWYAYMNDVVRSLPKRTRRNPNYESDYSN